MTNNEYKSAKNAALSYAARRETSSTDMIAYLVKKGHERSLARQVTDELITANFINDERYARLWIRAQAQRGKGALWISHKLKEKNISIELRQIKTILEDAADTSEEETARKLVARKYPKAHEDPKVARRASQMLLRNGYSFATVRAACANSLRP